jgi:hypothetical protein
MAGHRLAHLAATDKTDFHHLTLPADIVPAQDSITVISKSWAGRTRLIARHASRDSTTPALHFCRASRPLFHPLGDEEDEGQHDGEADQGLGRDAACEFHHILGHRQDKDAGVWSEDQADEYDRQDGEEADLDKNPKIPPPDGVVTERRQAPGARSAC